MKLNILLSLLFLFSVKSISQTKSTVIIVDGVCMMCENRIEKKAIEKKRNKISGLEFGK